jgi:lysozyme
MAYQMGVDGVLKFKKMMIALQAENYEAAYKEALNSKWAQQTPERAQRVALLIRNG